jgi:hypothetical protein
MTLQIAALLTLNSIPSCGPEWHLPSASLLISECSNEVIAWSFGKKNPESSASRILVNSASVLKPTKLKLKRY